MDFFEDENDQEWLDFEDEYDQGWFDFEEFFRQLEIPEAEQSLVEQLLEQGVEDCFGPREYLRKETEGIGRLAEPHTFGFGMLRVLRSKKISPETKIKVADYALSIMVPDEAYGIPRGLTVALAYLAELKILPPETFQTTMTFLDMEHNIFGDAKKDEILRLVDWVLTQPKFPEKERAWWLWYMLGEIRAEKQGKPAVEMAMKSHDLSDEAKKSLCRAWLMDSHAGEPPSIWRAFQAFLDGDEEAFAKATSELGKPTSLEELLTIALKETEEELGEKFEEPVPMHILSYMFQRGARLTRKYLKGQALVWLARLGEDPLALAEESLWVKGRFYPESILLGVADIIAEHHERMPGEELRDLIDRALEIGTFKTRQAFYELGAKLLGPEYLESAFEDNSNKIRQWAAQKLGRVQNREAKS